MKLYEIVGEYNQLLEMLEDTELDEQIVLDTLEGVKGELEVKAAGYIRVTKQLEADTKVFKAEKAALKDEVDFWNRKVKTTERNIKHMKDAIMLAMEATGNDELEAEPFKLSIVNNGGVRSVTIVDPARIPEEFIEIQRIPKTDAIRDYLTEMEKKGIDVPWAKLEERGRRLSIK